MLVELDEVLNVLQNERDMEYLCSERGKEMIQQTKNPFHKILWKKDCQRFEDHAIGIGLAISKIKRVFEES